MQRIAMSKFSRIQRQLFLACIDVLLLCVAIPISLLLRNLALPSFEIILIHFVNFLPIIIFWIICMYTVGFYILEKPVSSLKRVVILFFIALLSLSYGFSWFYIFRNRAITPRYVLIIFATMGFLLITIWRHLYNELYFKLRNYPTVLFIGYTKTVGDLINSINAKTYFRYEPKAIYAQSSKTLPDNAKRILQLQTAEELEHFFMTTKIDIVVLTNTQFEDFKIRQILFSILNKNILVYSIQEFYENATRQISLNTLNDSWILTKIDLSTKRGYLAVKRVFDVLFSACFLILFSPLLLIVSALVKLTSNGPVFFKQVREGVDGKNFTVFKFRTMRTDDNSFEPTKEHDNRITPIGSFLRKTRLDEIPQMLNVLKGEMSLIGPRPERPELAKDLENSVPFYRQRLLVKPGITGWDQVSGEYHSPSVEDTTKKIQYDLYYIKNISIFLDISIFFKTIMTVFKKTGL